MTHLIKLLYGDDRRTPDRVLNLNSLKSPVGASTLIDGLVSYWALDETSGTRYDAHGSNDLTAVNNPGSAAGKLGNAADFVAANSEYLSDGDILGSQWTISGWTKTTNSGAIFGAWNITGNQRQVWLSSTGILNYSSDGINSAYITGGAQTDGNWHHWVVAYDGTTLAYYLDGSLSISSDVTVYNSTAPLLLGWRSGTVYFTGQLDEIALYDRALSAAEIAALYNGGTGLAYPFLNETYGRITLSSDNQPAPGAQTLLETGSSIRFDGQRLVNQSRDNMRLTWMFNFTGSSAAEYGQIMGEVLRFKREALNNSINGTGEAVWLEHRFNPRVELDDLPRPTWGQLNQYARVLDIEAKWPASIYANTPTGIAVDIELTFVCEPYWYGLEQQALNSVDVIDATASSGGYASITGLDFSGNWAVSVWAQGVNSVTPYMLLYYLVDGDNSITLSTHSNAANLSVEISGSTTDTTLAALGTGNWAHLVLCQFNGIITAYVNGVSVANVTGSAWGAGLLVLSTAVYTSFTAVPDGVRVWVGDILTATEIAALYAEELPIKQAGGYVGLPPYLYTYTANQKIFRGNSTTAGTGSTNAAIVGNVNGTAPALARYVIDTSGMADHTARYTFWLGRLALDSSPGISTPLTYDITGTTTADTSSHGDDYASAVFTNVDFDANQFIADTTNATTYSGRYLALARLKTPDSDIKAYVEYYLAGLNSVVLDAVTVSEKADFQIVELGDFVLIKPPGGLPDDALTVWVTDLVIGDNGLDTTIDADFLQLIPYPYVKVAHSDSHGGDFSFVLDGQTAYNGTTELLDVIGPQNGVTLEPDKYNLIVVQFGDVRGAAADDAIPEDVDGDYLTLTTYITPRWTMPGGLVA